MPRLPRSKRSRRNPPGDGRVDRARERATLYSPLRRGAIAQLGERLNGIQKVRGSNPLSSTTPLGTKQALRRLSEGLSYDSVPTRLEPLQDRYSPVRPRSSPPESKQGTGHRAGFVAPAARGGYQPGRRTARSAAIQSHAAGQHAPSRGSARPVASRTHASSYGSTIPGCISIPVSRARMPARWASTMRSGLSDPAGGIRVRIDMIDSGIRPCG